MVLPCFENTILTCAVIDFGIQWGLFIISAVFRTEKFYDLAGSGTFILLTYLSYHWSGAWTIRQQVQSGMVMVWALRLGLFLFARIMKTGRDRRFDRAREHPPLLFLFWTIQGVWVFVTLLPTLMLNKTTYDPPFGARDYAGWTMWVFGLFFEAIADFQKAIFRNNPKNAGKFINSGLWSISRHPNYFGELLMWTGLYMSASSVMNNYQFFSVLCPIFNYILITQVSGIPPLERYGVKKWGTDPEYQDYLRSTSVLIPFVW